MTRGSTARTASSVSGCSSKVTPNSPSAVLSTSDALVIGCALARPGAIAYWSAVNNHGLTEQLPGVVFVAIPAAKFNPSPEVLEPRKFFGIITRSVGRQEIQVTDLEKTVADALDHPEYSGGVIEGAKALYTAWPAVAPPTVLAYVCRLGNSAVGKRLGFLLERFGLAPARYLEQVRRRVRPGLSKLEPLHPFAGPCCTRWGLRLNLLSPATVRDWEQRRYAPDQAARTLLRVIAREPDAVRRALAYLVDDPHGPLAGRPGRDRSPAASTPGSTNGHARAPTPARPPRRPRSGTNRRAPTATATLGH